MPKDFDVRRSELSRWLAELGYPKASLNPASSDASARRYFRFVDGATSLIAVDTPQPLSENQAFLDIAHVLSQAGLRPPRIYHSALAQGWMLLEDFGSQTFAQAISALDRQSMLYSEASDVITKLQTSRLLQHTSENLPSYNESMVRKELNLFTEWGLQSHLDIPLSSNDLADWRSLCSTVVQAFDEQPQSFVHRDFHSRNLMVLADGTLGIIDFQGAVRGPITYDWASLLRDCYIALPKEMVQSHLEAAYRQSRLFNLCQQHTFAEFSRWFDYTGLQRHLKAIGIFCRLNAQEGKSNYLADIPRTFNYVLEVVERHEELAPLAKIIERHNLVEQLC